MTPPRRGSLSCSCSDVEPTFYNNDVRCTQRAQIQHKSRASIFAHRFVKFSWGTSAYTAFISQPTRHGLATFCRPCDMCDELLWSWQLMNTTGTRALLSAFDCLAELLMSIGKPFRLNREFGVGAGQICTSGCGKSLESIYAYRCLDKYFHVCICYSNLKDLLVLCVFCCTHWQLFK